MLRLKIYGPPGTGKTTALVRDWIKPFKDQTSKIAVVSLTRATAKAFRDTLNKQNINFSLKNCRTMHSWCFQSLKAKSDNKILILETIPEVLKSCLKDVFNADVREGEIEDMSEFLENMEYSRNEGVALWQACCKVMTTWDLTNTFQEHLNNFIKNEGQEFGVTDAKFFYDLLLKYIKWKKVNGVLDFIDLLMQAFAGKINPFESITEKLILIIDEIQDLYPLAFRIFQRYAHEFDTVIIAGDDDQTIFSFAGANPAMFLNYKGHEVVLNQSYRLPKKIHEYAMKIISKNTIRKMKEFYPQDREGYIDLIFFENLIEVLQESNKDTLLLARTKYVVQEYVQLLEEYNIPYTLTLSNVKISEKIPRFIQIHECLKTGQNIPQNIASEYLDKFLEEVIFKYVKLRLGLKRLQKEMKKKIKEAVLTRDPQKASKFATPVREIFSKTLEEMSTLNKATILKWRYRIPKLEEWLNPKIKVGTIHSAKGIEADRVIIDPRITQKIEEEMFTPEGLEAERRVWYVAVTRAKEELFIIDPPVKSFYRTSIFPLPDIS